MHSYKRHIGDYNKKAGRLSMLQDGAYNRLLDCCYDREDFPRSLAEAIEWAWASTEQEREAVEFVFTRFFEQQTVGRFAGKYTQSRTLEELLGYWDFCEDQARKGKRGGRPKGSAKKPDGGEKKPDGFSEKADGKPAGSKKNPNLYPITYNQKPSTTPAGPETEGKPEQEEQTEDQQQDEKLARWMFEKIRAVMPLTKEPNFSKWADCIRLMRERDKLPRRTIAEVFKWANLDDFWATNIRSPDKLRKHFATLDAKRKTHAQGNRPTRQAPSRSDRADEALRQQFGDDTDDDGAE